ncbi:MAG: replication-associated recombination protein A [Thermodesulfobacteriota bacterium]
MRDSKQQSTDHIPLAERMRPEKLSDFIGQEKLLGEGRILSSMIESGKLSSIILWGPPGCGKTTLAKILARTGGYHFAFFSAVLSGVKEVRAVVTESRKLLEENSIPTLFFVDEIHRFNKSQQDAFLPHVESGLFTLIGATTENPSFEVISPLLSRCRVLVLEPLKDKNLAAIIQRALTDDDRGLGKDSLTLAPEGESALIGFAQGDARMALSTLEISSRICLGEKKSLTNRERVITEVHIEEAAQKKMLRYDQDGEEHYNLISALHKSLRDSDPDGALYWLHRMLDAGEDPLYILRRLIRFASEDVGISDPSALTQTVACRDAYQTLGLPEGRLALTQAVVYLATAPKSNALYLAEKDVRRVIRKTGTLPVPLWLRNAPTKMMKSLGYGKGYRYAHDDPEGLVDQEHLPEELKGSFFYHPTNRAYEGIVMSRLDKWRALLAKKKHAKK